MDLEEEFKRYKLYRKELKKRFVDLSKRHEEKRVDNNVYDRIIDSSIYRDEELWESFWNDFGMIKADERLEEQIVKVFGHRMLCDMMFDIQYAQDVTACLPVSLELEAMIKKVEEKIELKKENKRDRENGKQRKTNEPVPTKEEIENEINAIMYTIEKKVRDLFQ